MRFPHDWQPMPEHPEERYCRRCGVVEALCGTETCSAEDYYAGYGAHDA